MLSAIRKREAVKLYKKGIASHTVGKILRMTNKTVLREARKAGVTVRPRGRIPQS